MKITKQIVNEIFDLKRKKERKEKYKYIAEGKICVNEILKTEIKPEYIVMTDNFYENTTSKELINKIEEKNIQIFLCNESLFKRMVSTVSPQGILTVLPMQYTPIEKALKDENAKILILDKIADPGNLGTIIRSAVAFNISGIILSFESVELYNPKVIRSALGSHLHIPILYGLETDTIIEALKKRDFKIYVTVPRGGIDYRNLKVESGRFAFIFGNEHHGIDSKLLDEGEPISIKMNPDIESLNLAVSASILMSRITKI